MLSRQQLHPLVAPTFDAYEIQRFLVVGSCVATAAVADYAGAALPQRIPVALGAAALGILLVLRRRPKRLEPTQDVTETEAMDETTEPAPKPRRTRAGRAAQDRFVALAASIGSVERELEAHEARLVSLSGRQSLLQVDAREKLADFDARLQEIETRLTEAQEQTQQIRLNHIELLRQLNDSLAEHRQALLELASGGNP